MVKIQFTLLSIIVWVRFFIIFFKKNILYWNKKKRSTAKQTKNILDDFLFKCVGKTKIFKFFYYFYCFIAKRTYLKETGKICLVLLFKNVFGFKNERQVAVFHLHLLTPLFLSPDLMWLDLTVLYTFHIEVHIEEKKILFFFHLNDKLLD